MIGELSSALPFEGGYYAWVRRAMGNFWRFQEAWLSLVASIFDMAIYPTLFVAYLTRLFPPRCRHSVRPALIYGASLTLEFLALVVLRIREPQLRRPFRVPGGMFGAVAVGLAPVLLLGFDLVRSESEQVWGMRSFALGAIMVGAGVFAYALKQALKPAGWSVGETPEQLPKFWNH